MGWFIVAVDIGVLLMAVFIAFLVGFFLGVSEAAKNDGKLTKLVWLEETVKRETKWMLVVLIVLLMVKVLLEIGR